MRPPKVFVLIDPFHDYAIRFIDVVTERFGYRPICIHTTGRAEFRRGLRAFPSLRRHEHLFAPPDELDALGARLARERDVAGAIPFSEAVLGPTIALLRGLGSAWNDECVVSRLRDKFTLKERLRTMQPPIAVGGSRRAASGAEVSADAVADRFVVKPNGGYGNKSVGFFNRDTPREEIERFVRESRARDFVVEEYHPGAEYFVNGQADAQGTSTVFAVFRYERVWANGAHVDWLTYKVPHDAPEFALLESYARIVVTSISLRRSPFHLELKLCGDKARLVEMNARLVGNGNAFLCEQLHGGKLDVFGIAADHYLHDGAATSPTLDWAAYDSREVMYVHGVAEARGLIRSLRGIDAIERHPRFAGWVKKPALGQVLRPTCDLFSAPWCFLLQGPRGMDLRPAASELRPVLRINQSPAPLVGSALQVAHFVKRVLSRVDRGFA